MTTTLLASSSSRAQLDVRRVLGGSAGLLAAGAPAALAPGFLARLAAERDLARLPHPYWIPERALELYVLAPLLVASAVMLFLGPGLLAALVLRSERTPGAWIATASGISLVLVSACAALLTAGGWSPVGRDFGLVLLGLTLASSVLVAWRTRRAPLAAPEPGSLGALAWCVVPPALIFAALVPKFLWEDFNGDGCHAFEAARLLLFRALPFWDPEHTGVNEFPGITSFLFLYPLSWYERLFGPCEAAPRLAYTFFLAFTAAVFLWASELGARRLTATERAAAWLGLATYTVAMAFSATYSPHNADIALPATQDTFVVAAFVAYALSVHARHYAWAAFWVLVTWFAAPNGPLLALCAPPAWFLATRPIGWRRVVVSVLGIVVAVLGARALVGTIDWLGWPPPGDEYASESLASRFKFLILVDGRRFLFALLPAGLTPFAALYAWRDKDALTRFLWLVAAGSFTVFYVQAGVALHHFVPAMLLPIAAFWRWRALRGSSFGWTGLAAVGALVALVLVRPVAWAPRLAAQTLAATLSERSGEYASMGHAPFARVDLLFELYPFSADPRVPNESYGGASIVWLHYARHERPGDPIDPATNAILQGTGDPRPADFELLASDPSGALWLRDPDVLAEQLAVRQATPAGSPLFAIDHTTLFRQVNAHADERVIDVRKLLLDLGLR